MDVGNRLIIRITESLSTTNPELVLEIAKLLFGEDDADVKELEKDIEETTEEAVKTLQQITSQHVEYE